MENLTPPSSSATTPVPTPAGGASSFAEPAMDVDSPVAPLSPSAEPATLPSDAPGSSGEPAPPAATEKPSADGGKSALTDTEDEGAENARRKENILDSDIVDRWNKEFGDVFAARPKA